MAMQLRRLLSFLVIGVALAIMAACGGTSPSNNGSPPNTVGSSEAKQDSESTPPPLIAIKLSYQKNGGQTPQFVAERHGFYEKHGLKVERVEFENNSHMVGAMNSGQVDIVASIPSFMWSAREAGYDLVTIMQNEATHLEPPDSGALIVHVDSGIKEYKDLEGKKLVCSSLNSQNCLNAEWVLKENGVDLSKIEIIEAPFTAHFDLLNSRQVDAAVAVDPFTTQILMTQVGEVLFYHNMETAPGQSLGAWWVTRKWLEENEATALKFQAAIKDAIDFLKEDDDRAREEVGAFTGLDEEVLKNMPILNWSYDVDPSAWEKGSEILVEMGALQQKPNPDDYFSELIKPYFIE